MNTDEKMTPEEIHNLGVRIAYEQLEKEGYEMVSARGALGINPQITIRNKDKLLYFIAVRTVCYPEKAELEEGMHFIMMNHAHNYKAIPYFIGIQIVNADAKTEEEKSLSLRGGRFHVSRDPMLVLTTTDRVKLWDEKGIRDYSDYVKEEYLAACSRLSSKDSNNL